LLAAGRGGVVHGIGLEGITGHSLLDAQGVVLHFNELDVAKLGTVFLDTAFGQSRERIDFTGSHVDDLRDFSGAVAIVPHVAFDVQGMVVEVLRVVDFLFDDILTGVVAVDGVDHPSFDAGGHG